MNLNINNQKEFNEFVKYISAIKVTNEHSKKCAKAELSTLNMLINTIRTMKNEGIDKVFTDNYEVLLYARDNLKKMIKTYEALVTTNFRLTTLENYIKDYNLTNIEAIELSNTLFRKENLTYESN